MVGGHRYLDGGTRSHTNADLAAGHDEVLVIAPVDRGSLEREVALLRDAGSTVTVIRPIADSDVLGHDLTVLDAARRPAALALGVEDDRKPAVALADAIGARRVPA